MTRLLSLLALFSTACGGQQGSPLELPGPEEVPQADPDTADSPVALIPDPTGPADATADPALVDAVDCLPTDNALRLSCTLSGPEDLRSWVVAEEAGEEIVRTDVRQGDALHMLSGLPADSAGRLVVYAQSGDRTEAVLELGWETDLPAALTPLSLQVDGELEVDPVLFDASCGDGALIAIADSSGRLRWYEDLGALGETITELAWTEAGTIAAIVDERVVIELGLDGQPIRQVKSELPLHGGLVRVDEALWTLAAGPAPSTSAARGIVDTLRAFDADGGVLYDIDLVQHVASAALVPQEGEGRFEDLWPGEQDLLIGSQLAGDDLGNLAVALPSLDAVLVVQGWPGTPSIGQPLYSLAGTEAPHDALPSTLDPGPWFSSVRALAPGGGGTLALVDDSETPTALTVLPDLQSGTAETGAVYGLPSGSHSLDIGSWMLSSDPEGIEARGTDTAGSWRAEIACISGAPPRLADADLAPAW